MNLFEVIKNLYTNNRINWLNNMDEPVEPKVIQRWLSCDDRISTQVRWLDKYVFCLPTKMYLSLAWSIIPKSTRQPFLKYIKINKDEEELDFVLKLIRKQFNLSDNDYKHNKKYLIQTIKNNMSEWFKYYGIPKVYWKQYYLNFDFIKTGGVKVLNGLEQWGLTKC